MRQIFNIKILTSVSVFLLVLFSYVHFLHWKHQTQLIDRPVVVWWTRKFPGDSLKTLKCSDFYCDFTNIKERRFDKNVKGFLFYGSDFNHLDLPLPRMPEKYVWGLLHEESPRNTPVLAHEAALNLFNYSATISRYSNVPLTLQYLTSMKDLLSTEHFLSTAKKNKLLNDIAPVLYIQSDCDTQTYRDDYVKELMKYIRVDSYGKCLNNKELPADFKGEYLNNLNSEKFLQFVARYKFTIAFENGVCNDYITEKLWRPLIVGSVPIYMGSPTVRDWLPNQHSAIIAKDYETPKHLAAYLEFLNSNDVKYEEYLKHKTSKSISNGNIVRALRGRAWDNEGYTYIENFECFVCKKIHENDKDSLNVVNKKHYECFEPTAPFPMPHSNVDWWYTWQQSKIISDRLYKLVVKANRSSFSSDDIQTLS